MTIRVVSLDDHLLIREGIRRLLESQSDVCLVGEGVCGDDLFPLIMTHDPDIVLLDLGMPQSTDNNPTIPAQDFRAFPAIMRLRKERPDVKVIIVSQYLTGILVDGALESGVQGYLLKNDALTGSLVAAIRCVHMGGVYFSQSIAEMLRRPKPESPSTGLSERQQDILKAMAANPNLLQSQHARNLGIAESTLKQHLRNIYQILGAGNLTAAILRAIQLDIIPLSYVTTGFSGDEFPDM